MIIKETVSVTFNESIATLNIKLIITVEDTVVFLTRKRIISRLLLICKKCASHFREEPSNENKLFKETKTCN